MPSSVARRRRAWLGLLAVALAGCGPLPRDAAGALERVRGGTLRVGIADAPPWVRLDAGRVDGIEPRLIEAWAARLGARVRYRTGAEAELVEALHRREIDVMAAGLDASTPHAPRLGLSQPYLERQDRHGRKRRQVLAVTQGESALLLSLDRHLAGVDRAALARQAMPR